MWTPPPSSVLERDAIMFIEHRLYFCPLSTPPPPSSPIQKCTIVNNSSSSSSSSSKPPSSKPVIFIRTDQRQDKKYHYQPFFSDFGPPDLGAVFRFCDEIATLLQSTEPTQRIVHCVADTPTARSNGAFLTAAYTVLRLAWSPRQAFAPLLGIYPPIVPFRDASYGLNTYTITVLDCLNTLNRAISQKLLSTTTFDHQSYLHYSRIENGDWNWLVVDKLLAFSGPHNERRTCMPRKQHYNSEIGSGGGGRRGGGAHAGEQLENDTTNVGTPNNSENDGNTTKQVHSKVMLSAYDYAEMLRQHGVTDVVRLNDATTYDKQIFITNGFRHHDMYFTDGAVPSSSLLRAFLNVMETSQGAVAVHCKAGLGRTGTMACAYMMKK